MRCLTIKIADGSRRHDRNQQHGSLEHVHVVIIRDELSLGHKVLICALGLCRETADIAFSGEEIVPQEVGGQPAPIFRPEVVYVIDEADVLLGFFFVLHEAEDSPLGGSKVLSDNRKERKRHRMQRAQLTQALFFTAHVEVVEISNVLADGFHQLILFRIPLLFHTGAGKNRTANQLVGCTLAYMEIKGVVTVNNLLVDLLTNLADPARCTVNNQEHEEGLLFAELRERLKHIVSWIVTEI